MIHPVIRVICFLILSGFVAFGGFYELMLGLVLVSSVVLIKRFQLLALNLRVLKRMKWFFLSILIVYLWFTPGVPIVDLPIPGIPTIEGLRTGSLRVMSLVLIIFAVNYFVSAIARTKLVEAIVWILYPINWIGIDSKTIALRIALVLELIPKVQNIVLNAKQDYQEQKLDKLTETKQNKIIAKLVAASRLVEQLFVRVLDEAVEMPHEKISIAVSSDPPIIQWGVPILLVTMFLWAKTL